MAFEPKRTTELDELTSIANDDYYIVVDSSDTAAGVTKKVSHLTLSNAIGGGGGTPTTDASDLTSGTLDDARLSSNVTLKGNTFNGVGQLVELDESTGFLPVLDGRNLQNLNASTITSGFISAARLPTNVQYTLRSVSRETTATTVNIDDDDTGKVFIFEHASGTMVVNLNLSTSGSHFSIVNLSSGDVQIQDTSGTIIGPSSSGTSLSFIGKSPGSRRVEVMVTDSREYAISGDL
jgi:hypothetical protein